MAARDGEEEGCGRCYGSAMSDERDHWIRLFNRLDAAINHHKRDTEAAWDVTEADEALYAAQQRILRDAGTIDRPKSGVHQET